MFFVHSVLFSCLMKAQNKKYCVHFAPVAIMLQNKVRCTLPISWPFTSTTTWEAIRNHDLSSCIWDCEALVCKCNNSSSSTPSRCGCSKIKSVLYSLLTNGSHFQLQLLCFHSIITGIRKLWLEMWKWFHTGVYFHGKNSKLLIFILDRFKREWLTMLWIFF